LVEVLRRQRQEIDELVRMAERVVGDLESAGAKLANEGEVLSEAARSEEVLRNV
jgi:kinetochore protein NNF1